MTNGWSWYVIALVVLNIGGAAWLLWWTARRRIGDAPAEATSHHWDGDLTEYNKPLPRWWINLFWLTIVFAIGYLAWYPGFGNFAGRSQWSSRGQLAQEQKVAEQQLAKAFAAYAKQPIDAIARDPAAVATGQRIFANACAMCHGSDARGAKGYPDLSDQHWQWGDTPDAILTTILDGRQANMPPLAMALGGEANVTATAVHVQSLSGMHVDSLLAGTGATVFGGICAACHGADGKGNPAIGSADLTDDYWLYGSGLEDIRGAIEKGHNGQMPAQRQVLGETRARLVGAYVWALSHPAAVATVDDRPAHDNSKDAAR
ncbi:MAG: cytochrome-c oxidase, cbb3-type subunit III [Arenimonas sp.]